MKVRASLSCFLTSAVLSAALTVSPLAASAADREMILVAFDFQNGTAGVGGNLGDLVVPASFRRPAFVSATFAWTDPNGIFPDTGPGIFYDHGVQTFGWDDPADNVYSARGTGPSPGFTHFVITLASRVPWVLTGFHMQQGGNDDLYPADVIAIQGNVPTVLGTVTVSGAPTVVSLTGLNFSVAAGPLQILILPQVPSPTGSGYLAVDDIYIVGTSSQ